MPALSLNRIRSLFTSVKPEAVEAEPVFKAPPFTREYADAVRVISTRLAIKEDEASRLRWERENNLTSLGEYRMLSPLYASLEKPRRVLEIGPGLGRSAVAFSKLGLFGEPGQAEIHLYDADGTTTQYKQKYYDLPPDQLQSFCGNLGLLRQTLEYNQVTNFTLHDASRTTLEQLPGPFDLIFAAYSIGFHWSLRPFLPALESLMDEHSLGVCTLNKQFQWFKELDRFHSRVLQVDGESLGIPSPTFLVFSRSPLPSIGEDARKVYAGTEAAS